MENPNQPNLDKQPENQPSGAQEALQQAEQTLRDATQSQPYTGSSDISQDDKNVAMLAHLLAPFFGFIPPLIFWLRPSQRSVEFPNYRDSGGVCVVLVDDCADWHFAVLAGIGCQFCVVHHCRHCRQQRHGIPLSVCAALD